MSTVPPLLHSFIDDAAIYPPANTPLVDAVRRHHAIRHDDPVVASIIGPFVIDVPRLPAALALAQSSSGEQPLDISVVVRAPATVGEAMALTHGRDDVSLIGLEIVESATGAELQPALADAVAAASTAGSRPTLWIELTEPSTRALIADDLGSLVDAGCFLKLRTGGLTADAFPTPAALARLITLAVALDLPFKCTAGLHSAVRHVDPGNGFGYHGFLNILLAVIRSRAGGTELEATAILELEDESLLVRAFGMVAADDVRAARAVFRSYGSCSIDEPLEDLRRIGIDTGIGTGVGTAAGAP